MRIQGLGGMVFILRTRPITRRGPLEDETITNASKLCTRTMVNEHETAQ